MTGRDRQRGDLVQSGLVIACVAFAIGAGEAPRDGGSVGQASGARPTAPVSDVLVHSPLESCAADSARASSAPTLLRAATWNIAAARIATIGEIAAEIQAMRTDLIAVQEVDMRVRRTGFTDQPAALAAALDLHHVFAAAIKWDGGDYGLGLFSRWPLVSVERHRIEVVGIAEPRIVLEVVVCVDGRPLRIFNHHADVTREYRQASLARLAALVQPGLGRGLLVTGDFNAPPDTPAVRALLSAGLVDVAAAGNEPTSANARIDYMLVDSLLSKGLQRVQVWPTRKSDHHALIADFRIE